MISKMLIIVSVALILLGLVGIRTKSIKKKLLFLVVTTVGMLMLPFSQGGTMFGILGGVWQVVFKVPAMVCFILLVQNICRCNAIQSVEGFVGVRQGAPYLFAASVIFSIVLMGMPGTGTFIGYLYSALGLMTGGYGIYAYIGLSGILLGFVISAAITFSILKPAYLPEEKIQKLSSKADSIFVFLAFLFILCCIFQNQIVGVVSALIEKIFS